MGRGPLTAAEIPTGRPHDPCAVRRAAITWGPKPAFCRIQTTVTVPRASIPACGATPCPITTRGPQVPPAGLRVAVTDPEALHTTVVVPAASTTTSGLLTCARRSSVTTGPHPADASALAVQAGVAAVAAAS